MGNISQEKKIFLEIAKNNLRDEDFNDIQNDCEDEIVVVLGFYFNHVIKSIIEKKEINTHLSFLRELIETGHSIFVNLIEVDFCYEIFFRFGKNNVLSRLENNDTLKKVYNNSIRYWNSI